MSIKLRDYQKECLEKILEKQKLGVRRQLVSLPTGSGKTVVFASLIKELGKGALVLAHTNELLTQAQEKIEMVFPGADVGLVNGTTKQVDRSIVISSIQSARQPETLQKLVNCNFNLIIVDECHHSASDSYKEVLSTLGFGKDAAINKLLVGFSATPFRKDGRGLAEVFDEVVFERSIGQMIDGGFLCHPRGVRLTTDIDLREISSSRDDYEIRGLANVIDTEELRQLVVAGYKEHANGLSAICFTCSVDHAQKLTMEFEEAGISSEVVHGELPKEERASALARFKEGKTQIITNCQVLTEGFDAPHASCIIVARPTQSKGLYQQMVGRGLRRHPGKTECVVIDFNDVQHTLCNASVLLPDAEVVEQAKKEERRRVLDWFLDQLPQNINKKIRSVFVSSDLLGDAFNWKRDKGERFYLRASTGEILVVFKESEESYGVKIDKGFEVEVLAEGLTFEYAFGAAEDYARQNRNKFILADKEAEWRDFSQTQTQTKVLRGMGYPSGIEELTRGQASDLIASGVLC